MRSLVYLAVVFGLLAISLAVHFSLPSKTPTPCVEPVGEATPPSAAPTSPARVEGTITVEGDDLSPEAKQAFAEAFRKILSDAIHEAVNKGIQDLFKTLRITDELEAKLLAAADIRPDQEPDADSRMVWSILLIRPGPADEPPETIEAFEEQTISIRFTRVSGSVERPAAVAALTWLRAGRPQQKERFLIHGADSEWQVAEGDVAPDGPHDK